MVNHVFMKKEDDEFSTKEKLQYGLLGLIVLSGTFFIGRSIIRNARSNSEEKKTYQEGNAATYAKQIRMAFENDMWWEWGTDEEALRRTIRAIPSKDAFRKVINSYQKLYARSMMADMQNDLSTAEYNEMLAIIAAKPDSGNAPIQIQVTSSQILSWSKRLKAAFNVNTWGIIPYGTDEDAIKAVFMEIPTQAAFWETSKAYQAEYGSDLIADLKGELELWEWSAVMGLIGKKPKV